jgi:hypothetical protein
VLLLSFADAPNISEKHAFINFMVFVRFLKKEKGELFQLALQAA